MERETDRGCIGFRTDKKMVMVIIIFYLKNLVERFLSIAENCQTLSNVDYSQYIFFFLLP